jgi:DNA/RNA endonuclease YhcR with UshA esterase domain
MKLNRILPIAALLFSSAVAMLAHHSFDAEFDRNKPITLTGTVTKVEFMNPHMWIYIDVKDDKGVVTAWQIEGGAPNALRRNGWTADSVKKGETVTIDGTMSKDGSKTVNARSVVAASGKRLFAGSSEGDAKAK